MISVDYSASGRLAPQARLPGSLSAHGVHMHVPEPPGQDPNQPPEIPPPSPPDDDVDLPPREIPEPIQDPKTPADRRGRAN